MADVRLPKDPEKSPNLAPEEPEEPVEPRPQDEVLDNVPVSSATSEREITELCEKLDTLAQHDDPKVDAPHTHKPVQLPSTSTEGSKSEIVITQPLCLPSSHPNAWIQYGRPRVGLSARHQNYLVSRQALARLENATSRDERMAGYPQMGHGRPPLPSAPDPAPTARLGLVPGVPLTPDVELTPNTTIWVPFTIGTRQNINTSADANSSAHYGARGTGGAPGYGTHTYNDSRVLTPSPPTTVLPYGPYPPEYSPNFVSRVNSQSYIPRYNGPIGAQHVGRYGSSIFGPPVVNHDHLSGPYPPHQFGHLRTNSRPYVPAQAAPYGYPGAMRTSYGAEQRHNQIWEEAPPADPRPMSLDRNYGPAPQGRRGKRSFRGAKERRLHGGEEGGWCL